MKKTTGSKIRLGIFVSTGIAVFITGIYFIGQRQQLFSSTFHVSGIFQDISGLQVGNNVRFSGINVGIIEDIEQITDSTVRVEMVIEENTRRFIKTNAKAIIGSDGLMGSKMISIVPGPAGEDAISHNAEIETVKPVSMDDILLNLKITTDNAALITDDLSAILTSVREGHGTIGKLLMDSSFSDMVGEALFNIKQGAGGFKQNMDAASHNILLRGYLKKKNKKEAAKVKEEAKAKEEAEIKKSENVN